MARPGRQRLTADLPIPIYKQLKYLAAKYNLTLTKYLLRIIVMQIKKEQEYE